MARVDVRRESAPDVHIGSVAPDDLPGLGVVARRAGCAELALLVLVDSEDFKPGPRRIEIADVQRVAVA